jgi:hypothetical protein
MYSTHHISRPTSTSQRLLEHQQQLLEYRPKHQHQQVLSSQGSQELFHQEVLCHCLHIHQRQEALQVVGVEDWGAGEVMLLHLGCVEVAG